MRRIGIAVVGLGAAVTPHARSLVDLADRVDVVWAASRSEEKTRAFAARFPFPVTTDVDAAIADPRVEAVMVLTPPAAHLEVAGKAFAAGRHVLVEKPLELTTAKAERLVAAGRAAGKRLAVTLQHRFRPASRRLAVLVADGSLGPIEAALAIVPWWRPQGYYDEPGRGTLARDGGGVLLTQAIHTLDLFRALVGGVERVEAAQVATTGIHRMETEDWASALLRLRNGAPATVIATTAAYPGTTERIEILARHGSARIEGGSLTVAWHDGRTEAVKDTAEVGAGAAFMDFPNDAHRALLADFLDAIEEDRDPLVPGEDALATQQLVDAILAAGARTRNGA
ncbi:Gfo/Idh/MocA family protein [Prosthecomicrobium sp. N25]|uniref:Gfo/Idh/MocA family protein n=1 Tax=Prosthecomicrobium sp. N25 TaxID=3129254 RepID=UPI003077ABA9